MLRGIVVRLPDALFGDSGDAAHEGVVVWFTYARPYTIALLAAALVVARRFEGTRFLTVSDILAATYGLATQVAGGIAPSSMRSQPSAAPSRCG